VNRLREALGDSADSPRFIETLPRRGYRFVALKKGQNDALTQAALSPHAVRLVPHSDQLPTSNSKASRKRALGLGFLVLLSIAPLLWWSFQFGRRKLLSPQVQSIRAIAVLPLENLTGDPGQEFFADGMTDALITALAKVSSVPVISRTSVMYYKGKKQPLPEIARQLNVDAVVEGTVAEAEGRVRVDVQLIHAPTDKHLWAESVERNFNDVLALQDEAARDIARQIQSTLVSVQKTAPATIRPINRNAYQLYLKGRFFWAKRVEFDKAIEYFRRSADADPSYAPAYSGLADAYVTKVYNGGSAHEFMPKAEAAALRAIELEPELAEAHTSLADVLAFYVWDWSAAEREYKAAIKLNFNSAGIHQRYALFLALRRRFGEANYEAEKAEELDPLSPYVLNTRARVLYYSRQFEPAEQAAKRALELDPHFALAHAILGFVYQQEGKDAQAVEQYETNLRLWASDMDFSELHEEFKHSGIRGYWSWLLNNDLHGAGIGKASADDVALDYAVLGRSEESLLWWKKAYEEHSPWVLSLGVDPLLDRLRQEPGFQELRRLIGLPE
jgi:TolB-like protein